MNNPDQILSEPPLPEHYEQVAREMYGKPFGTLTDAEQRTVTDKFLEEDDAHMGKFRWKISPAEIKARLEKQREDALALNLKRLDEITMQFFGKPARNCSEEQQQEAIARLEKLYCTEDAASHDSTKEFPRKETRKRFYQIAGFLGLIVFFFSCLFPPWQSTFDRNGNYGGHSRKPAGYSFILSPPPLERQDAMKIFSGVQIDFTRLVVGWVTIGVSVGGVCLLSRMVFGDK